MTEYVYTSYGRQRPIKCEGETIAFHFAKAHEGVSIDWTDTPIWDDATLADIEAGRTTVQWHPLSETSGVLKGATAIRVNIPASAVGERDFGWVSLIVQTLVGDPDADCIGAVALFNSRLAAVNRDMRAVAAMV